MACHPGRFPQSHLACRRCRLCRLCRRSAMRAAGKVDRPGDEVHGKGRLGLVVLADHGWKQRGDDLVLGGRQLDGRVCDEEVAHQIGHGERASVQLHVLEHERALHVLARCRLERARPRLGARAQVRLARAAAQLCPEPSDELCERGERQGALLHSSDRRIARHLLGQRRKGGVEHCRGLLAREAADAQEILPPGVVRQLGHRKRAAQHDDGVAEPLVVRELLGVRAHARDELAVARLVDVDHDRRTPVRLVRVGLAVGLRHLREPLVELPFDRLGGDVRRWLSRAVLLERRVHDERVEIGALRIASLHHDDTLAVLAEHVLHERRLARAARAVRDQVGAGLGFGLLEVGLELRLELAPRHVFVHLVRDGWRHMRGEDRAHLHARAAEV
mmetsp:Transcript_25584/g.60089  ORF Transcript_25584/g.60089 Transcript_25584/m.60089 type:complete len:389 (-) Transcript_25584:517-1683(-)